VRRELTLVDGHDRDRTTVDDRYASDKRNRVFCVRSLERRDGYLVAQLKVEPETYGSHHPVGLTALLSGKISATS